AGCSQGSPLSCWPAPPLLPPSCHPESCSGRHDGLDRSPVRGYSPAEKSFRHVRRIWKCQSSSRQICACPLRPPSRGADHVAPEHEMLQQSSASLDTLSASSLSTQPCRW